MISLLNALVKLEETMLIGNATHLENDLNGIRVLYLWQNSPALGVSYSVYYISAAIYSVSASKSGTTD
jgi:hypothetical protein